VAPPGIAEQHVQAAPPLSTERFIALPLAPAMPIPARDIRIELRGGATSAAITWPAAAADRAAWRLKPLK
jgi:hypothetical protein